MHILWNPRGSHESCTSRLSVISLQAVALPELLLKLSSALPSCCHFSHQTNHRNQEELKGGNIKNHRLSTQVWVMFLWLLPSSEPSPLAVLCRANSSDIGQTLQQQSRLLIFSRQFVFLGISWKEGLLSTIQTKPCSRFHVSKTDMLLCLSWSYFPHQCASWN